MATKFLNGIVREDPIRPALSNDIESFCWVILYVNHQRALAIADRSARHEIFHNFSRLFAATSVRNLLQRHSAQWIVSLDDTDRYYRATRSLTDYVEAHIHEDLAGFLGYMWHIICSFQPQPRVSDVSATCRRAGSSNEFGWFSLGYSINRPPSGFCAILRY